jgi:hypothetical protein
MELMNVFIARAGKDIGKFPREEIPNLLEGGTILETDQYWHRGMEGWGHISDLLAARRFRPHAEVKAPPPADRVGKRAERETPPPPPVPPKNWALIGALLVAVLTATVGLGSWLIKPDWGDESPPAAASLGGAPPAEGPTDEEVREKAAADLRQSLDAAAEICCSTVDDVLHRRLRDDEQSSFSPPPMEGGDRRE